MSWCIEGDDEFHYRHQFSLSSGSRVMGGGQYFPVHHRGLSLSEGNVNSEGKLMRDLLMLSVRLLLSYILVS